MVPKMFEPLKFDCIYFNCRIGAIWLGYHEPEPQDHSDVRLWSDCSVSNVESRWDPGYPPSTDVLDSNLCVVLNSTNLYWKTVECNETYGFVCQDKIASGKYISCRKAWNPIPYLPKGANSFFCF